MRGNPFFSVIIPTYDRAGFLKKAVDSVLAQDLADLELIVYDDGSTDATPDLISSYGDDRLIYIRDEKNRGVAYARNRALEIASGPYVAFLDSDDRWKREKLSVAKEYIRSEPCISIFHTEEIWYRKGKLLAQKQKHRKPDGRVYRKALPLCCISISTAVVKKDVFGDIGWFDESLEACEDYDFWLRSTSRYEARLIPEALTLKDGGRPDQLSSRIWGLDRFRIKALEKMLSRGNLPDELYSATLAELMKKCRIFAKGAMKRGNRDIARRYLRLPARFGERKSPL